MRYFITATDTNAGKTIASAYLAHHLNYAYFKPIQSGEPSDSSYICDYFPHIHCIPAIYDFKPAIAPHLAAERLGESINLHHIPPAHALPEHVIIEGAGGVLTPIDAQKSIADLMNYFNVPVILVSRSSLGTINHTLLSIEALQHRSIVVHAIIMMGQHDDHLASLKCRTTIPIYTLPWFNERHSADLAKNMQQHHSDWLRYF